MEGQVKEVPFPLFYIVPAKKLSFRATEKKTNKHKFIGYISGKRTISGLGADRVGIYDQKLLISLKNLQIDK